MFSFVCVACGAKSRVALRSSLHTHEHARTREAFVEMRGEATHTRCKARQRNACVGDTLPVCGIQAHRTFVNTLALYACISSLFSLALSGAVSVSVVSRVSTSLFHSLAGPKAPFRQQPRCPGEFVFCFISPVTSQGHHQGLFLWL